MEQIDDKTRRKGSNGRVSFCIFGRHRPFLIVDLLNAHLFTRGIFSSVFSVSFSDLLSHCILVKIILCWT